MKLLSENIQMSYVNKINASFMLAKMNVTSFICSKFSPNFEQFINFMLVASTLI